MSVLSVCLAVTKLYESTEQIQFFPKRTGPDAHTSGRQNQSFTVFLGEAELVRDIDNTSAYPRPVHQILEVSLTSGPYCPTESLFLRCGQECGYRPVGEGDAADDAALVEGSYQGDCGGEEQR